MVYTIEGLEKKLLNVFKVFKNRENKEIIPLMVKEIIGKIGGMVRDEMAMTPIYELRFEAWVMNKTDWNNILKLDLTKNHKEYF